MYSFIFMGAVAFAFCNPVSFVNITAENPIKAIPLIIGIGVVTCVDGKNVYVQDATGAICVRMSTNFDDITLGDTIIGTKGRVAFEAPAPLIIVKAHHLLEKHVLTKKQLYWKEQLSNWYGQLMH